MIITIFGKRGSGKTTLIRENLHSFPGPVAVIDVLGNYDNPDQYSRKTNLKSTHSMPEFIGWLKSWSDEPDEASKIFVLKPSDPALGLDFAAGTLWHLEGGTLVFDEADSVTLPEAPAFDSIIRYGRNRGVHVITGVRRPAEISRNITAGSNKMLILQTQEPLDIDYYKKTILYSKAEHLMRLPDYSGFEIDYDKKTISIFKFNQKGQIFISETEPF